MISTAAFYLVTWAVFTTTTVPCADHYSADRLQEYRIDAQSVLDSDCVQSRTSNHFKVFESSTAAAMFVYGMPHRADGMKSYVQSFTIYGATHARANPNDALQNFPVIPISELGRGCAEGVLWLYPTNFEWSTPVDLRMPVRKCF